MGFRAASRSRARIRPRVRNNWFVLRAMFCKSLSSNNLRISCESPIGGEKGLRRSGDGLKVDRTSRKLAPSSAPWPADLGPHRGTPEILTFHPSTFGRGVPMWETCSVQLEVRLPRDVAAQAEEVQKSDPEFLSRVVLYGLTRRSIYRHLREQDRAASRCRSQGIDAARLLKLALPTPSSHTFPRDRTSVVRVPHRDSKGFFTSSGRTAVGAGQSGSDEPLEVLRAKYLDYCSAQVADLLLYLSPDEIYLLAQRAHRERGAGGDISYVEMVKIATDWLALQGRSAPVRHLGGRLPLPPGPVRGVLHGAVGVGFRPGFPKKS